MGTGTFLPKSETWEDVNFFYVDDKVDITPEEFETNNDVFQYQYNDLRAYILEALSDRMLAYPSSDHWIGGKYGCRMLLLADNHHYDVAIAETAIHYIVAVGITSQIGHRSGQGAYKAIAKYLLDNGYRLSLRTGTYTTRKMTMADL